MWLKHFCVGGKVLIAGVLILALRSSAAVAPALYASEGKASSEEVAASLLQGVAWIWPDSNGPPYRPGSPPAYREAAVLVESLVLRATVLSASELNHCHQTSTPFFTRCASFDGANLAGARFL